MENAMGNLLRIGVALAAAVVLAGAAWYLWANGLRPAGYHHFHPAKGGFRWLATWPSPEALIQVGLLILIATPVARVIFSLVAFVLERDRAYVAITLAVLAILVYSIAAAWW